MGIVTQWDEPPLEIPASSIGMPIQFTADPLRIQLHANVPEKQ